MKTYSKGLILAALGLSAFGLAYLAWFSEAEQRPQSSSDDWEEAGDSPVLANSGLSKPTSKVAGTWEFKEGGGSFDCGDIKRDLPLVSTKFTLEDGAQGSLSFSDQTCDYTMRRSKNGATAKDVLCSSKQQPGQTLTITEHDVTLIDSSTAQVKMSATFSIQIGARGDERQCTVVAEGMAKRAQG